MTGDGDLRVEVLGEDGFDAAWEALEEAFGAQAHPADRDVERASVDPARFRVVRDRGAVVGTAGSFALTMGLPGGPVPVAGITWVGVAATHRRRGLLTALMTGLLADLHEAGEPVAALWASEAAIYQRFGFGPASWQATVRVPSRAPAAVTVAPGGLHRAEPGEVPALALDPRLAAAVPGWLVRGPGQWTARLHDAEHRRSGASPLRAVVTDDGQGYALYATTGDFDASGPAGEVRVREVGAATPEAAARLWRFLLDLDLMRTLTARVALDDPLLHLLAEPRAARPQVADNLWVRPVDVGPALEQRAYAADVDVVLDVSDPTCPWNARRWRLSADRSGATCTPTTDPVDLALGVADLGAALLGGSSLASRAAAGRVVEHVPGALAAAATALGPRGRLPFCPQVF